VVTLKKFILKTFLIVFYICLIILQIIVCHHFNLANQYKFYNQKNLYSSLKYALLSTSYVQNENIDVSNKIEFNSFFNQNKLYILKNNILAETEFNSFYYKNEVYNKYYKENNVKQNAEYDWYIEIPKIELIAEISEGTDQDILNKYVGHFEETSKLNGNVGLAAHNRGYDVNYFAKIKELEFGDEIYYYYKGYLVKYKVEKIEIINETDWSFLEPTEDKKITLITCVEDMPELRRCIQAIEIN
jgi:LPXTG-site transpeptidase (sortase) family protein